MGDARTKFLGESDIDEGAVGVSGYEWFAATTTVLGVALVLIAISLMIDGRSEAKLIVHDRPAQFSSSSSVVPAGDGTFALHRRTDSDGQRYLK